MKITKNVLICRSFSSFSYNAVTELLISVLTASFTYIVHDN